jgi:hypothetical protein
VEDDRFADAFEKLVLAAGLGVELGRAGTLATSHPSSSFSMRTSETRGMLGGVSTTTYVRFLGALVRAPPGAPKLKRVAE